MMRRILNITFLLLVALLATHVDAQVTSEDAAMLRSAQQALTNGKHAQAVSLAKDFLSRHPDSGDAYRILGHAQHAMGDTDAARKALVEALSRGRLTTDVIARLVRIDREREASLPVGVGAHLLAILDPDRSDWKLLYAQALLDRDDVRGARAVLNTLVASSPADASLWAQLAGVAIRDGDVASAVVHMETAYHLGFDRADLPTRIAGMWARLGNASKATRWMRRADRLGRDVPAELRISLAALQAEEGRLEDAEASLQSLLEHDDAQVRASAHQALASIRSKQDRPDAAIAHLREATAAGVRNASTLRYLASHHLGKREFKAAAKYLEQTLALVGPDRHVLRQLIDALIRLDRHADARARLITYLEHHGRDDHAAEFVARLASSE